jgi:hypothetical protein
MTDYENRSLIFTGRGFVDIEMPLCFLRCKRNLLAKTFVPIMRLSGLLTSSDQDNGTGRSPKATGETAPAIDEPGEANYL